VTGLRSRIAFPASEGQRGGRGMGLLARLIPVLPCGNESILLALLIAGFAWPAAIPRVSPFGAPPG